MEFGPRQLTDSEDDREFAERVCNLVFRRNSKLRGFFEYVCAKTAEGKPEAPTERSIALEFFNRTAFDPSHDNIVRVYARRVRSALARYNSEEGLSEDSKLGMPKGDYRIAVLDRESGLSTAEQDEESEIPTDDFKKFLLSFCDLEGICDSSRNELIWRWVQSDLGAELNKDAAFDEFFERLASAGLALDKARSIAKFFGFHSLLLDSLRSQRIPSDRLLFRFEDFRPVGESKSFYGERAQYSIPRARLNRTDASFVYLTLRKNGRSDTHRHPGDELMLVLDGTIRVRFHESGIDTTLHRGDLAHFHAEQTHSVTTASAENARLFIMRFHQLGLAGSRQEGRSDLIAFLESIPRAPALVPDTIGWLRQLIAHPLSQELYEESIPEKVNDGRGLGRLLRRFHPPRPSLVRRFLRQFGGGTGARSMEEWLAQVESGRVVVSREVLHHLGRLYTDFDLLFLHLLFPAIPGAVICRRNSEGNRSEPGRIVPDLVDPKSLDPRLLSPEVSYYMPRRNLACSDTSLAWLRLDRKQGTSWNQHPGYEVLVPLDGEVRVQFKQLPDSETLPISSGFGQFAHFRASRIHRVFNPSEDTAADVLVIRLYTEGEGKAQPLSVNATKVPVGRHGDRSHEPKRPRERTRKKRV